MSLKLEQYRIFCTAAKCGSFSAAAAELYMTQSAVSQHIAAMERELGAPLFIRQRGGVSLTGEGALLLEYAKAAMSLIDAAERKFSAIQSLSEGELRIGAGDTITKHYLLRPLEAFHTKYPDIRISITNRVTNETIKKLKSGHVELAFINLDQEPLHDPDVECISGISLTDVFAAGSRFEYLKGAVLTPEKLSELPLVMLENRSSARRAVNAHFEKFGVKLSPDIELGSHDLLLDFAAANLGAACVIREFSEAYLDSGELFELTLSDPIPKRHIGICTLKGVSLSPAAGKFLALLKNNGKHR